MPEPDDSEARTMRDAGAKLSRELAEEVARHRLDERFMQWLRQRIRTDGGSLPVEPRNWVLVQGCSGSDSIDGVYGPYTEAHADWLLGGLLEFTSDNWTKIKLSSGPEGT